MGHFTVKKLLVYLILLAALVIGYQRFTGLPVTRLAFVESDLKRGPPGLFSLALSKVVDGRRELIGNDAYKVYAYTSDKDGLQSVSLTHNGDPIPFKIEIREGQAELEFEGNRQMGLHRYVLSARDQHGNKSTATLVINLKLITPIGGVAF